MIAPAPGRGSEGQEQDVFTMLPGQEGRCVFTMLPSNVRRSQAAEVEVNAEGDQHGQRDHGDSSRTLCQTTAEVFSKDDRVTDLVFEPHAR